MEIASIRERMERKATLADWGMHKVIWVEGRLSLWLDGEGGRLVKGWMERASDRSMVGLFVEMSF